jgi:hypothetical protein
VLTAPNNEADADTVQLSRALQSSTKNIILCRCVVCVQYGTMQEAAEYRPIQLTFGIGYSDKKARVSSVPIARL